MSTILYLKGVIPISKRNYRPGVYSSYTVSSRYGTPRSQKAATLICSFEDSAQSTVLEFKSFEQVKQMLENTPVNKLVSLYCQLLFEIGVSRVNLLKPLSNIFSTTTVLSNIKDPGIVIADVETDRDCLDIANWVMEQAEKQNEMIVFFTRKESENTYELALSLNNQRCVVCSPATEYGGESSPIFTACALAGKILVENNPSYSLNSLELPIITNPEKLTENEIQLLIEAGVSVIEPVGSTVECIRTITTCTNIDGAVDYSFRSLNTVLIIDDVMESVRSSLKRTLKHKGIATHSLDSVSSQVLIELASKQEQGLIESYQLPRVTASIEDPTVCIVEIAFNIAHVISQIYITAHIGL